MRRALYGSKVLTTTGEHEYTRYGFRKLIADRAVDVLQPDITWLGGLTEARGEGTHIPPTVSFGPRKAFRQHVKLPGPGQPMVKPCMFANIATPTFFWWRSLVTFQEADVPYGATSGPMKPRLTQGVPGYPRALSSPTPPSIPRYLRWAGAASAPAAAAVRDGSPRGGGGTTRAEVHQVPTRST